LNPTREVRKVTSVVKDSIPAEREKERIYG
jgi:hypothetical protein